MNFSISLVKALWPSRPARTIRGEGDLTTFSLGGARANAPRRTFLARSAMAAGVAALQPWELLKSRASEGRHAQLVKLATPPSTPSLSS